MTIDDDDDNNYEPILLHHDLRLCSFVCLFLFLFIVNFLGLLDISILTTTLFMIEADDRSTSSRSSFTLKKTNYTLISHLDKTRSSR